MKIWSHRIAQNINKKFENFCPEYLGHNFSNFFVHILGNAKTPYFLFEIYWPLTIDKFFKVIGIEVEKNNSQNNLPADYFPKPVHKMGKLFEYFEILWPQKVSFQWY